MVDVEKMNILLGNRMDATFEFAKTVLEELVMEVLEEHHELSRFFMSMGTWGFDRVDGEYVNEREEAILAGRVCDFMAEWDTQLCLSGEALQITRERGVFEL